MESGVRANVQNILELLESLSDMKRMENGIILDSMM